MTENIDKTKNYERTDRFGNPLVADWMFMYLVNAGREELERNKKRNKDVVNISEEGIARDLYSAVLEASNSDKLNQYINKDILVEDCNEIVGYILDANIDFNNALENKKAILSHGYKGYVPDELVVNDFKHEINKEYNEYKQTITKNFAKEGIFDRAFEISFFTEMNDYLQSLEKKDVEDVKEYKKNDFTLAYLYDRYIHNEFASIANGSEIKDFLTNEISRSNSRYQENEIER